MSKPNVLASPRGGVLFHFTKREARKVLAALSGPSVTDRDLARVYDALKEILQSEIKP